jgi:hypothetical protein
MSPEIRQPYARAMRAALSGSGYSGMTFTATKPAGGPGHGGGKPLFDFTATLKTQTVTPVSLIETVIRKIRDQDWSEIFLELFLFLIPSGFAVFFVRDRYYRRRGSECIALALKVER